ncbi:GNAT family N-acetyltransferase [Nocardioides donggukensis]|uniref:GNAT family N-acetyltransferase n=1 Tax=Nocardioides donggukensis TaxID=2774019 RepID=UPI00191EFF24|nr:GNAT family N-acetyltransferase [Nocardioides donggukensis]
MRTTLPDRPGALAVLAGHCGAAGVNILGLQVFPGVEAVTDELVLQVPTGWGERELVLLVEGSGGRGVRAVPCTEGALADQPTRYVQAARRILAEPAGFPEVVARLLDGEPDRAVASDDGQDSMELRVDDVLVQLRRAAPFTATEHARGAALAELVTDVLARARDGVLREPAAGRAGAGAVPDYVVEGSSVSAVAGGRVVGRAELRAGTAEPGVHEVTLRVDPVWQRRGIGTRLLTDVARLASGLGGAEIVLTTDAGNQAVLPMVLAAGLRSRIRMAADRLVVRIPVHELKPLRV